MKCAMCDKELADDEVYVCEDCADECRNLEVVEKMKGDSDATSGKEIHPVRVVLGYCRGRFWHLVIVR